QLKASAYGGTNSDFVLVNGNAAGVGFGTTRQAGVIRFPARPGADMVVENFKQGGGVLVAGVVYGSSVETGVIPIHGNQILKVHEVFLGSTTNTYTFTLQNLSGTADLNISLY